MAFLPARRVAAGPAARECSHSEAVAAPDAGARPARVESAAEARASTPLRAAVPSSPARGIAPSNRVVVLLAAALAAAPARGGEARDLYALRPAVDVPVTLAALAAYGVQYAFPDLITPRCPCDRGEVNRLDRFAIGHHSAGAAVASDVTVGLAMVVPPVADALRLGLGATLRDDVAVFVETLAVNGALGVIAKNATQRPLPLTYEGRRRYVESARGYRSFYSGHTSTIAAALTATAWTIRRREGEQGWPWIVAGVTTASVAVERVAAGRHFPTDVAAGAAAGFAVGTLVPWLHLRRRGARPVALVPWAGGAAIVGYF